MQHMVDRPLRKLQQVHLHLHVTQVLMIEEKLDFMSVLSMADVVWTKTDSGCTAQKSGTKIQNLPSCLVHPAWCTQSLLQTSAGTPPSARHTKHIVDFICMVPKFNTNPTLALCPFCMICVRIVDPVCMVPTPNTKPALALWASLHVASRRCFRFAVAWWTTMKRRRVSGFC